MKRLLTPADFESYEDFVEYWESLSEQDDDMSYTEHRMRQAENHGQGDK